tara:strand:- start:3370 stop:3996 length:627 start_codon:yes stop_codon:yes gene_type:complete
MYLSFAKRVESHTKNLRISALAGVLSGLFLLIPAVSMGISMTSLLGIGIIASLIIFSIVLFLIGILISPKIFTAIQLVKFGTVGYLNAFLELTVVNVLIISTGVAAGSQFVLFKTIAFLVALINGYFWSKFWTFESKSKIAASEFSKFVSVTVVGAVINVGTASFIVNVIGSKYGIDDVLWANIAVIIAVLVAMIWNFFSQKYIIFKE